ncbi:hypothetical protein HK097_000001, partial [Rhizophlyctis rosea]
MVHSDQFLAELPPSHRSPWRPIRTNHAPLYPQKVYKDIQLHLHHVPSDRFYTLTGDAGPIQSSSFKHLGSTGTSDSEANLPQIEVCGDILKLVCSIEEKADTDEEVETTFWRIEPMDTTANDAGPDWGYLQGWDGVAGVEHWSHKRENVQVQVPPPTLPPARITKLLSSEPCGWTIRGMPMVRWCFNETLALSTRPVYSSPPQDEMEETFPLSLHATLHRLSDGLVVGETDLVVSQDREDDRNRYREEYILTRTHFIRFRAGDIDVHALTPSLDLLYTLPTFALVPPSDYHEIYNHEYILRSSDDGGLLFLTVSVVNEEPPAFWVVDALKGD